MFAFVFGGPSKASTCREGELTARGPLRIDLDDKRQPSQVRHEERAHPRMNSIAVTSIVFVSILASGLNTYRKDRGWLSSGCPPPK